MQSLWSKTTKLPKKDALQEDKKVPNVVIGAGMAGILIAYFLQKKGLEVIILEEKEIASGQTKNTTAKITSQHGLIYHDMIKKVGKTWAKGYAMANEAAIRAYEEIIEKEQISCHFEKLPSYLYSTKEEGKEKLEKEAKAAQSLGLDSCFIEGNKIKELPFDVKGAVCFQNQAQFHPLEFIQHISKKLQIYENTHVLSVKDHEVITNCGTIRAENIIFATHYPFPIVPGFYFLRQHQSRSYVLALEGEEIPENLSGMYYGIEEDGLSFRREENTLLFGGGAHRTGKLEGGFCYVRNKARAYYPKAQEVASWAAQDCMPHDKIPFIGKFSIWKPYWYVATGFQKWGMTSSMVAAMIISDSIWGRKNPYEEVFSPQRFLLRAGIRNFCMDIAESVIGLSKGWFGEKEKRCTHMGCGLVRNEEEETWECPCHGSRFDREGNRMDSPAQNNLVPTQKK